MIFILGETLEYLQDLKENIVCMVKQFERG